VNTVKLRGLRLLGHLSRANRTSPYRKLSFPKPEGARRVGRPSLRWLDKVEESLRILGEDGKQRSGDQSCQCCVKTNVSEIDVTLMMATENISETLVLNSTLTRLTTRDDFSTFIRRESFKSHKAGRRQSRHELLRSIHTSLLFEFHIHNCTQRSPLQEVTLCSCKSFVMFLATSKLRSRHE
jgi:hypothetical protein